MKVLPLLLCVVLPCVRASVRDNNDGNCVGTRSCRPRCITFRLDRSFQHCHEKSGVFEKTDSTKVAWEHDKCHVVNCTRCGDRCSWNGDLLIKLTEKSSLWSMGTRIELKRGQDMFTFCSIYPCPQTECALPEQLGTILYMEVFSELPKVNDAILSLQLGLTKEFTGEFSLSSTRNGVGPLDVVWMDDPTNCRPMAFQSKAPVAPNADPVVSSAFIDYPVLYTSDLFCQGDEYNPSPMILSSQSRPTFTVADETLLLWFRSRNDILDDQQIQAWSSLTRTFLRVRGLAVERVVAIDQSLEQDVPLRHNVTLLTYDGNNIQVSPPILMIQVSLSAIHVDAVASLLRLEWKEYVSFVHMAGTDDGSKVASVGSSHDASQNGITLLWIALTMTFFAISVILLAHSYGRRRRRHPRIARVDGATNINYTDSVCRASNPSETEGVFVNSRPSSVIT